MSFEKPGLLHICSKNAARSSSVSSKAARSCGTWRNPLGDVFSVARIDSKSLRSCTCSSGAMGALLSGVHQLGERCSTVTDAAVSAMTGMICTPLDPVPTTATRLPVKSTGVSGHSPVWYDSPSNSSRPGTSGKYGIDRTPVAATKWWARMTAPLSSVTVHSAGLLVVVGRRDTGAEAHMAPEVEPVHHVVQVALNLGLSGEVLLPLPVLEQLP